jgi:hypothetical protein
MSPSGMVEGTMVMVKPASMLFGGGASRHSVSVFRLVSSFSLVCFSWEFFVSSLRFRFFSLFKQRDVCAMLSLKHVFVLSGFKSHMINEKSGGDSLPSVDR